MAAVIRVLLVDDFAAFRRLIGWIFQDAPQLKVVGEAADGREAIVKCEQLQPDIVVLDIGLPDLNGIEVAQLIRTVAKQARVIFLTENKLLEVAREALKVGNAFIVKSDVTYDLLNAIDTVMSGKKFVSRSLAQMKLM